MKPQKNAKHAEWIAKLYAEGNPKLKKQGPPVSQEEAPTLFPDLMWTWEAFCFLSERRGANSNGPLPITFTDIFSYCELTGRNERVYKDQLIRFIPVLDRIYLKDFYDKQNQEIEKQRKKAEAKAKSQRFR